MKKFKFIVLSFCFIFVLIFSVSCSKKQDNSPVAVEQAYGNSLNLQITKELESFENISSLDDETIKAMSVVIRTNLVNENQNENNLKNNEYKPTNNHIYELVNETDGEILENENSSEKINHLYINEKDENEVWVKEIKKVDILNFLKTQNISLSNLSKFENNQDENGRTKNINLGGKSLNYKLVMEKFNLPSNKIYSIENHLSSITIRGIGSGTEEEFFINDANNEAKAGENYQKILKNRYNNFKIITNK